MNNLHAQIDALIAKSVKADKSEDAIRFSQAACNVANAANVAQGMKPIPTYKGHGVVAWDWVEGADLYIVTVKNQTTKQHMTYQMRNPDKRVFKFMVTDPNHSFHVEVTAIGFDGKPMSVPNHTLTFVAGDPVEFAT